MKSIKLLKIFIFALIFSTYLSAQTANANLDEVTKKAIETAQISISKGESTTGLKLLLQALTNDPQSVQLKFWIGKIQYSQGNYLKAVESLKPIVNQLSKNSSEYAQTIQILGLSHYILGQLADSIPYLEQIFQQDSANGEIAYALGVSYIQTRQPVKSREIFSKLFKVPTNSASAYLLNAKMHIRQQFEETAELELNKAVELDPKLPEVRFVLGELAIYRAEIDKGIEFLKQEITINPASGMAYYRLGEAYSRQLKWEEAIPPLQRSIWINPFFSGPYIVLGKVYFKKKDLGNAENLLRRSTVIDPNNFGAHHLLAQVLQQAGKLEEAKAEFTLAEKLRGKNELAP